MGLEARDSLSAREARRIVLAAQGLARPRPEREPSRPQVLRQIDRLGLLQIDSVNVFARAHTMPLFSRLGPYDQEHLSQLAYAGKRRALFEYWAHEASYLPLSAYPLMRWRMERAARGEGIYKDLARFAVERRAFVEQVLADIARRGPLSAGEIEDCGKSRGGWWGWSEGKIAVEYLFWAGKVTVATRRGTFERVYDIPERVFPRALCAAEPPSENEAHDALMRRAASALGVATERDLRDYFRLDVAEAKASLARLVVNGDVRPVRVEGWKDPAFLAPDAALPRKATGCALLSPFDPLVFERSRTERLFDFHYRLEIYTPQEKRQFGYYTLPFLMGERLVGRVDLKADRAASRLLVLSAHHEPGVDPHAVGKALAGELERAARWLRLDMIEVAPKGDLAPALAHAIG
ncbi:MAG: winged helix-turn-helix domain-containing protein [Labrys sp. (in: a-proteobacteria)]